MLVTKKQFVYTIFINFLLNIFCSKKKFIILICSKINAVNATLYYGSEVVQFIEIQSCVRQLFFV